MYISWHIKTFSSRYAKADYPFGEASQNPNITESHMKYMLAKMLCVSELRKIPSGWHCAPCPKVSKGSIRAAPERQGSLRTKYHVTKGDLYLGGSLPRVYTAGKNFLIL